ncbi:unnamed protein product [Leptidea sinapis]|uniref:CRAL-TRIO domain-containing protein n=1 Tax=Leptidea sinapis TaxID=189913 RepID=A0A5E4Q3Q5_9NEOP|nr:unnamed protein product [Leptidea sinapis]
MPIRPLIPELAEKARLELNEDPKRIESDLQHLKEWISKQPHLKARTDDQWLIVFLRACKHSLERTKEKLDLYYSMRTLAPEFFQLKITDDKFKEILESGCFVMLPKLAAVDGQRVCIARPGAINTDKFNLLDFFAVSNAIQTIMLIEDDNTVVSGIQTISDLEGMNMGLFLQMTPSEAAPMRFKSGHHVNVGSGFEKFFNAIKVFLNEKTKSRLHVHNKNFEEMYKTIPKEILPVEYGGNGGSIPEIVADQKIASFLRGCKHSLERTKEKLDMSYTLRTLAPEIFQKRDPLDPKIQKILTKGIILPLKRCENDGCRPILTRFDCELAPECSIEDMVKVCFMVIEVLIEEDDNIIICGEELVSDLKKTGFALVTQFTAPFAKKLVTSFEKGLPVRMKAFYFLNPPTGIETAFFILKFFISEKLKKRVHNQNSKGAYDQIPQELLPQEYGGNNGSIEELIEYWKTKLESYRDWFLAEEESRSNESLRPNEPKTTSSLFGVEGSFRKLDLKYYTIKIVFKTVDLKMTIRPLSGPLQEKAIKELFEDPERVESDIAAIRTWLQKQPHLESANPSDQRIVSFLRGNKYSLERTKEKLDMSYTLRSLVPEIFQNRDPLDPKIRRILAKGTFLPLSKCAKEDGPRPVLFHVHNKNFAALYEKFPQEMLPEEYGGRNGSIQELTDYWKGKVESRRDWFLEEDKARSNEYLRPGKPKTTSSLFGVEGSFRKLDVD